MRNILITVMLLIVTAALYTAIVTASDGIEANIKTQGETVNDKIAGLSG